MSDDKFKLALQYSANAIKLHVKAGIPPYPKFYELFYTYSSGTNTSLNEKLNRIFSGGGNPSAELIEALYDEFLCPREAEERLSVATDVFAEQLANVNGSINAASSNANNYSEMLEGAIANLGENASQKSLNALTKKILTDTKKMQEDNARLERKLASAKDDVSILKSEIDDVRRDAMLDPLTKINNRKSFDREIEKAVSHSKSSKEPLSLLMIDIDHFKQFNDNHGHQTGDQVLRLVGATLDTGVRDTDTSARYGGEEFSVILPEAKLNDAINVANKLRTSIESRKLHKRSTNEDLGRITVSVGVAMLNNDDDCESLIGRADRAMYVAKENGRNQVIGENNEMMDKEKAA